MKTNDKLDLYKKLKSTQESMGYYLHSNLNRVFELLESLIFNEERLGYMSCPCRPASYDIKADKDIICPCIYRKIDIMEYGNCYCNLFNSKKRYQDKAVNVFVPDRRPLSKYAPLILNNNLRSPYPARITMESIFGPGSA